MPRAEIAISPTVTIVADAPEGMGEADTQKAIIEGIAFWQSLPTRCPMPGCGADLIFTARHPQNFHYYGLRCQGQKPHEMNLGERKDGTSLYVKDEWKDAYAGGDGQQSGPASAQGSGQQQSTQGQGASPTGDKADQALVVQVMRKAAEKSSNALEFANNVLERKIAKLADMTTKEANSVLSYLEQL